MSVKVCVKVTLLDGVTWSATAQIGGSDPETGHPMVVLSEVKADGIGAELTTEAEMELAAAAYVAAYN